MHLPNVEAVYDDADEWGPQPWKRGASILHIELRRWADMLIVAPLSANTLAKIVNGMSDNLLTSGEPLGAGPSSPPPSLWLLTRASYPSVGYGWGD
jgi:hypothetical protein